MSAATTTSNKKCQCECDILLWKNPIETGKYFFGSIIALLILKKVNLLTFLLRVLYTVFLTTGTLEFATKLILGQGIVTKYGIKECPNTVGLIKPYVDEILKQLPVQQAKMRMLVFAYVPKNTFKAAGIAFALHRFFSWFSVWTILFVADIMAFTVPIVYHTYQKEIDAQLECACKTLKKESDKYSQLVCEKVKPHLEKLGPLAKLCQSSTGPNATTTKLAANVPVEEPTSATTTSADLPSVPKDLPTDSTTKEFNVDELTNEIKQSTNSLKNDFETN
ncbi:similar to Saccharomyces cerevisiae YDR233C RTN1 ER membrane protein that interacts with Sey1p to maintain ER morphology [Maudiozyma saulgeensis]|uniref:Reticulon-like protein n=1 Tax=Maudiozyma saulgeensis TaxID=1789683 RepID=A0A1X7R628_9SACH|nr:similar to Saccharomyces cerevisiae YDR233C RTN1 ER membrane protein that interacts with Sey1p to maintain ER morphology [Kazachstania saulgeensis]